MKIVLALSFLLSVNVFAENCSVLDLGRFNLKTDIVREPVLLSDGTVVVGRQNERDYLFIAPDRNARYFKLPETLGLASAKPFELLDGRVAIGAGSGLLFILNPLGEVQQTISVGETGYIHGGVQLLDGSMILSAWSGDVANGYKISPVGEVTKIYTDKNGSFIPPTVLFDGHIVLNRFVAEDDAPSLVFLNPDGKMDFGVADFNPNPFQAVTEIGDGTVAIGGRMLDNKQPVFATIDIAAKKATFREIPREEYPLFIQKLSRGDLIHGIIVRADERFNERLEYYGADKNKKWEFYTPYTGFDMSWRVSELPDGTIVNGVGYDLQFLSPDGKLKADFRFDEDGEGGYENARDVPMVLSDGTVVIKADKKFYYLKLVCP